MSKRTIQLLALSLSLALALSCCSGCTLLFSGGKTWTFGTEETEGAGGSTPSLGEAAPTDASAGMTQEPAIENTVTFSETTLVSNGACAVTAVSFDPEGFWGPTFSLSIENNTDKTLMFTLEDVSVNGYMCDPFWACEVTPGSKANSEVAWMDENLQEIGVNYLDQVEFRLRAYDSNDYSSDDVLNEIVTIQLDNSTTQPSVSELPSAHNFEAQMLIENADATLTLRDYDPEGEWGPTLVFYCENKTDRPLTFMMDGVSVNGFMCDPYWSCEVAPGKKALSHAYWAPETLAKSGINYLELIEFDLRLYDADDWAADDILVEPLSIQLYNIYAQSSVSEVVFDAGFPQQTVVDTDALTLIAKGFDPEGYWGPTLIFYCVNKTDKTLMLSMSDVSVNGYMCDPYWSLEIAPGKKAYSDCAWMSSDLEGYGIVAFENVKFTLQVYDSNDWSADYIIDDVFQVTF